MHSLLEQSDPRVGALIRRERDRQQRKLSLIASENSFSAAVREAVGSVFSHKYAEGNVGQRYYEGNQHVDELEQLTIDRARRAFLLSDDWTANVQALSGSNANLAVYLALLKPGETMMGMYLPDGGHLSHGWSYEPSAARRSQAATSGSSVYNGGSRKVHITSRLYTVVQYKTDPATQQFDYAAIADIARAHRPKLLITGGTAYPRDIDYGRMREIADSVGAYYLADIAHEAGLIAAGVLPSPVGIADVVTMTTHKTLRSGRGAIILADGDLMMKINRAVLPGLQGGPHNHNIAGICVGLGEVATDSFRQYAQRVLDNAQTFASALQEHGFVLVTGGTDKHLLLLDLSDEPVLGKKFARALDYAGIVANANSMPQETRSPADPSALRVGTPWATTRGMGSTEMRQVASLIREVMKVCAPWAALSFAEFDREAAASERLATMASSVETLCSRFSEVTESSNTVVRTPS